MLNLYNLSARAFLRVLNLFMHSKIYFKQQKITFLLEIVSLNFGENDYFFYKFFLVVAIVLNVVHVVYAFIFFVVVVLNVVHRVATTSTRKSK